MKKNPKWLAAMTLCVMAAQVEAERPQQVTELKTQNDRVSYAVGVNIARNFKKEQIDFDPSLVIKGLRDAVAGERLLLDEKELRNVMNSFQSEVRRKMAANQREAADQNRKNGDAFLAENKNEEGVVALPSGVQYKILRAGDGRKPTETDTVKCNYRGMRLDGSQFDGTEPGKPATLKVTQLVQGWKEALKLMPAGSKWQIFVPSQLAYGLRGVGSDIGPNETLIFEVDLLGVS